ncbi:MAG: putative glycoside hydrolase [Lachnospiraceae bacterium]|nr:putative glycoside hydrolase [Lachnospiraceae bacterium]
MKSTISTDTEPASVFCRGSILRLLGPCLFAILSVVAMTGCGESAKAREVFARQSTENVQEEQDDGEAAGKSAEAEDTEEEQRPKVKGIFVTGPTAGTERMQELIELVEESELNTIVMDVKNDEGRIVYDMQLPVVQELGSGINYVRDMEGLIRKCKEKDIYLIARIVAFKDPFLAEVKPQWCIHNADGSVFRDKGGLAWLNPYEKEVWDYLLAVSGEILKMGFDEVQLDYVRFSTDSGMEQADLGEEADKRDRQEIVAEFIKYISEGIHEAGGLISADVYGMVIDSEVDQRIVGQNYVELSKYLDYISPMIYPSHYGPYNYDIPVPDAEPYRLVLTALQASKKVLAGIPWRTVSGNDAGAYTKEYLAALSPMEGVRAQVRPWLQDFTASWVKGHISYGPGEIRAQIQAVYDAGYEEWILWNASNHYTEDALLPAEDSKEGQKEEGTGR